MKVYLLFMKIINRLVLLVVGVPSQPDGIRLPTVTHTETKAP